MRKIQEAHGRSMLKLGPMLCEAREGVGLSQVQLAFMLGVHQSLVSRIEKTGSIDHVLLERYACVCNKKVSDFTTLDQAAGSKPLGQEKDWLYYSALKNSWEYLIREGRWPSKERLKEFDVSRLPLVEQLELQRLQLSKRIMRIKNAHKTRQIAKNASLRPKAK
jgi:transcriptional regulator with XRE-family HTH domain